MNTKRAAYFVQEGNSFLLGFQRVSTYVLNYCSEIHRTWKEGLDLSQSLGSGRTSWDEESKFISRTFTVSHHMSNQSLQAEEHSAVWLLQGGSFKHWQQVNCSVHVWNTCSSAQPHHIWERFILYSSLIHPYKSITWILHVRFVSLKINKQYTHNWKGYLNGR